MSSEKLGFSNFPWFSKQNNHCFKYTFHRFKTVHTIFHTAMNNADKFLDVHLYIISGCQNLLSPRNCYYFLL